MNCGDSSFINEIKDYSAEEIRLILSEQKDLYTPDEIEQLRRLLREKTIQASRPCSEETKEASPSGYKPSALRTIYCQKCGGPKSGTSDICRFCGAVLRLDMDDSDTYAEDEPEEASESFAAQYIFSFLIPLVGFIIGAVMLSSRDSSRSSCGTACILLSILSIVLDVLVWAVLF